jgi:hypothetical protein
VSRDNIKAGNLWVLNRVPVFELGGGLKPYSIAAHEIVEVKARFVAVVERKHVQVRRRSVAKAIGRDAPVCASR